MALITLDDNEILEKVKTALNVTGTYQNDTLSMYIGEVKEFILSAGVSESVVNSSVAVGLISRGVADLWNYGSGNAQFSEYFNRRLTQLMLNEVKAEEEEEEEETTPDKLTLVCTLTDKANNDAGRDNGIYQKGDKLYLKIEAWFSVARDSGAGWNINLAQIDDKAFYPPVDLFYQCLYNESQLATIKVWTNGLITLLPPVNVVKGDYIMIQHSGEYEI